MKSTPESCRYCKHWDIESAKDKAGRVRSDWSVKCQWKSTELWPLSVREQAKPYACFMTGKDGVGCPCFAQRADK